MALSIAVIDSVAPTFPENINAVPGTTSSNISFQDDHPSQHRAKKAFDPRNVDPLSLEPLEKHRY